MSTILFCLLVVFAGALAAPLLFRLFKKFPPWLLCLFPLTSFLGLLSLAPAVFSGERLIEKYEWVNALRFNFQFDLDGLSFLFALLITGIGTLIIIYAGSYLSKDKNLPNLYAFIFIFMGAMLGMMLSDNIFVLFIFWELTSISSYLLIGYHHEEEKSRKSALQALLVTGTGGLALIAGLILAANAAGSPNISDWVAGGTTLIDSKHFGLMLTLVLLGAFTKSAQFPFHFWLPNAMVAPTPVSAYLHSATMVKAGIYLLARLNPYFFQADEWRIALISFGGITMMVGAAGALFFTDLKKILAYTTISALGIMVFVIGIGTPHAIQSLMVFIFAHALYKGALFMAAGNIDHATGTREIDKLSGLFRSMPVTAIAVALAALSMLGIPFFPGFLSKELFYEAVTTLPAYSFFLSIIIIAANAVFVCMALLLGWKIFFKPSLHNEKKFAEAPAGMYLGPVVLGVIGLLAVIFPFLKMETLLASAAVSVSREAAGWQLSIWHGFTPALGLSIMTLLLGWLVYRYHKILFKKCSQWIYRSEKYGPEAIYNLSWKALIRFAEKLISIVQNGYLRFYIMSILVSLIILILFTINHYNLVKFNLSLSGITTYEILLTLLVTTAIVFVVISKSRLISVVVLGVIGYGIALFYAIYGGADLAMTQFLVETLTVVVFVYILSKLPGFIGFSSRWQRWRDFVIAIAGGAIITTVMLLVTNYPLVSELKVFFGEHSFLLGKGRNVVNVILVDFRALDTMGEITVLTIAAIGVFALIKLKSKSNKNELINKNTDKRMKSLLLQTAVKVLFPFLLIASLLSLFRGHNEPGGGFIGGLVAASAFILLTFAYGVKETEKRVYINPMLLIVAGLSFAFIASVMPVIFGFGFFEAMWADFKIPLIGKPGTPLLLDAGIYLVVTGAVCKIIFVIGD